MFKISIIIPVYNVEKYLVACIESIIHQTYQNLEIILVNDGSTDNSPQICDAYVQKDARIKVIHKKNGGLSDARNAGYAEVTGEYMAFVDSDDMIAANCYRTLLQISTELKADIVECGFLKFKSENELNKLESTIIIEDFDTEKALELLMKEQLKQVVWNKLYKTNAINKLLFEKGKIHEDEFWTYKVFANANKIVKTSQVLYFYRQQHESIMAEKYNLKRLSGLEAREERIDFIANKFPSLKSHAVHSFWLSALYNYQNIIKDSYLDSNCLYRKEILNKIKNRVKPTHYLHWNWKEILWLSFFLVSPAICSRFRNFLKIGI